MNTLLTKTQRWLICLLSVCTTIPVVAQTTTDDDVEKSIYTLSPFEVTTDENVGYLATSTLAGSRINTNLKDVGSAISVITKEFMQDTGAVDNETLLIYTMNTEVGGTLGNFTGADIGQTANESNNFTRPNSNTRIRGLTNADNTRDFFLTEIPWDGYVVDRVDLQRGPNSILFGLGSPAGIINTTSRSANFLNSGEFELRFGSYGSTRATIKLNKVLIEDELAVFVAGLRDNTKYRQNPAFENDDRAYVSFKWEPKFLKEKGIHLSVKGNYENGNINRNSPRTITPVDRITAWFRGVDDSLGGLGQEVYDGYLVQDNNTETPGHGSAHKNYFSGEPNPYFRAYLGNFADVYGNPVAFFGDNTSSQQSSFRVTESSGRTGTGGLDENGSVDNGVLPYNRWMTIDSYTNYAYKVGLPYANFGQHKEKHLTDESIFDFRDQLIDGPNKTEWNNFEAYNLSTNANFMNNMFGVELSYDHQEYEEGRFGGTNTLYIDINAIYPDGSANPNVGRPFISPSTVYGNYNSEVERNGMRGTAYADFNLENILEDDSWWVKLIGHHVFTGLYSSDDREDDLREFSRYGTGDEFGEFIKFGSIEDNERNPIMVSYLGDSLTELDSASGANIPNLTAKQAMVSGNTNVHLFDSTWNAGSGVDLTAPYMNYIGQESTQADNPANYVGWTQSPVIVYDAANKEDREKLTRTARKTKEEIKSKALVWQAFFWDGSIVGMAGWREDKVKAWNATAAKDSVTDQVILDNTYSFSDDPINDKKFESRSYSIAWHLTDSLKNWFELPFNISLYYNESENFQPAASRVDLLGKALGSPNGTTVDKSIMISTKDNRYALKITRYENEVLNASSSSLGGSWFIGGVETWGGTWANVFEYDLGGETMDTQYQGNEGRYTYSPAPGETDEQAAARELAAIAGWRDHQARVINEFPEFYEAWLYDDISEIKNLGGATPTGFTLTEDSKSEGYEIELIANPTNNWRLSINAAKVESTRKNVGGTELIRFMDLMTDDLNNTAAGDLRIWWGGAGNKNTLQLWNETIGSNWELIKLKEGTNVDELRKWSVNLVTNYNFNDGVLKGLNVGGSYRWADEITIGYPIITGEDGNTTYDLENPYKGPNNSYIDLWAGYSKALTDKIDWRVQINIRNAFTDDDLIPLSTQPDGSVAAWRIPPDTQWTITNTFSF